MVVSFKKAKGRFVDRTDIELIEYNGWSKESKFFDKVVQDYFLARTDNVYYQKTVHPKRRHNNKVTETEAREKLSNRQDIELIKYKGWHKNSEFFDKIVNEKFTALPSNVYRRHSGHPRRSNREKLSEAQARERFLDREDIELIEYKGWSKKSKFLDKKAGKTWWITPNALYYQKSSHKSLAWKKTKQTKLANGSMVSYQEAKKRLRLRKDLILEKDGYRGWSKKSKFYDTIVEEYFFSKPEKVFYNGSSHPRRRRLENTKFFVQETNESIHSWLTKQSEPKPFYTFLHTKCNELGLKEVPEGKLLEWCDGYHVSKTQLEVLGERLFDSKHFNRKPRQINLDRRPDFKLSPQIFANVDGLYRHSEKCKDKKYHYKLRKEFEENDLRIFQFREDEIREKSNICKSIVDNALHKTPKRIYARKCTIKTVLQQEATVFLEQNHLMGSIKAKHLGLYDASLGLVCLLSYKCKKDTCKIERFCSKTFTAVIGGFSKLLKNLERKHLGQAIREIHNWVDLRYGTGNHLASKDFDKVKETLGWKWTDYSRTYNRLQCRANMDSRNLSQTQHASELGWAKIYDAGQRLWIKKT